jgi:hypothetical protein
MNFRPRHIGHWLELLPMLAALVQVVLTVAIILRVYGAA